VCCQGRDRSAWRPAIGNARPRIALVHVCGSQSDVGIQQLRRAGPGGLGERGRYGKRRLVSISGAAATRPRGKSADEKLTAAITAIHQMSRCSYDRRRCMPSCGWARGCAAITGICNVSLRTNVGSIHISLPLGARFCGQEAEIRSRAESAAIAGRHDTRQLGNTGKFRPNSSARPTGR
jgi:hypothetical protein